MPDVDYVIVGAGSAGCVLANRLSADPGTSVLLLEAGGSGRSPLVDVPVGWTTLSRRAGKTWSDTTEPDASLGGRALTQPTGRLLGGTSSINGMMYTRGNRLDYDGWRDGGLDGWGYADVLPYFKRAEASHRGSTRYHGRSGPLHVSSMRPHPQLYPKFLQAATSLGYRAEEDFNVAQAEGFGLPEFTIHRGRRWSTARAYLQPARSRPNLTVLTGALVHKVLIEDGRATGVEYTHNGAPQRANAREVILCAGAYRSPQLLLLSGVGPGDELRENGVVARVDLPGVGRNLQDHPMIYHFFSSAVRTTFENEVRLDRMALNGLRWLLTGTGPFAGNPMTIQAFLKSRPELDRVDTQLQVVHVSLMAKPWFPKLIEGAGHQICAGALLLRPHGRGSIGLRSADPKDSPKITLNLLDSAEDMRRLRDMSRLIRTLFATAPVASLVAGELVPGPQVEDDDELDGFIRASAATGMHPVGTCAMGTGDAAVVDGELRVRGVDGLRVVDASVMPRIVSGNTNAPTIMIAERASDLILGRPLLPPEPDV